jgi:nucleotide-binding universal stress UspA family protein
MSFKKILVAIDRSPRAADIFQQALDLAQQNQASLMIYHAPNREDWGDTWPLVQTGIGVYPAVAEELYQLQEERLQQTIKQSRVWLQSFCQKAMDQGISVEFDCEVQAPGVRICQLANSWGADLIILGRRGRSGLAEMVLGSVSNHVVHHAPCSVLVTQGTLAASETTDASVSAVKAP